MASVIGSERPRGRGGIRRALAAIGSALAVASSSAEALADASAADKAAAETLFDEARRLVKERKYADACPKFAESLRLDTGIGTMLYLADCFEKNGQPASAWAQFREAAATANAAGQLEREKKARARAAALEPKLSRLSIGVSAEAADIAGLEVRRDGVLVSRPLWGSAVPVDPGNHVIEASAPGRKKWSIRVTIVANAAATSAVEVPLLERETAPIEPSKLDGEGDPPQPEVRKEERPLPDMNGAPSSPPADGGSGAGRVVGFTLIGVGAAGLAAGAVAGGLAIAAKNASAQYCRPDDTCIQKGIPIRKDAITKATVSTIALIAGGALATGGLLAVVISGTGGSKAGTQALRVVPLVGERAGGMLVEGVW
jgi:hypothetical protein